MASSQTPAPLSTSSWRAFQRQGSEKERWRAVWVEPAPAPEPSYTSYWNQKENGGLDFEGSTSYGDTAVVVLSGRCDIVVLNIYCYNESLENSFRSFMLGDWDALCVDWQISLLPSPLYRHWKPNLQQGTGTIILMGMVWLDFTFVPFNSWPVMVP